MTGSSTPSLTLLAAIDLLRNKTPAELTATEIEGLRARVQSTSPTMFASLGGLEVVRRYLAEAEAVLQSRAVEAVSAPPAAVMSPTDATVDRLRTRRTLELLLYVIAVTIAAIGLYALLRHETVPPHATATKIGQPAASTQAASAPQPPQKPDARSLPGEGKPSDDPPAPEPMGDDYWFGWQIGRENGATAQQQDDWDRSDASNPIPSKTLVVVGGPLSLTRATVIGAEDRWLMLDVRPAVAVFPGGQMGVSIDGREVARASIGAGESDWPMYVPVAESHHAKRQLKVTFTPRMPQQQVVFWKLRLVASQIKKPQPESPLLAALRSEDPAVRVQGITALSQVVDPLALGSLVRALVDPNREVRRAALMALPKYNASTPSFVVDALVLRLRDADPEVRRVAAQSLMSFDSDSTWVALTQTMTTHRDTQLRLQIAQQLSGRQHPVVRAAFEKLLAGADDSLRLAAINSLAGNGDPAVTSLLVRAMNDPEPAVRRTATNALTSRNDPAAEAAILTALASHSDMLVRRIAMTRFSAQPSVKALPAIRAALASPDDVLRRSAVPALGRLPGEEAERLLVQAATTTDASLRYPATELLGNRPGRVAEDLMLSALAAQDDPPLRQVALRRFGQPAFVTPRVIPALRVALKAPSALVRFELVELIRTVRLAQLQQTVQQGQTRAQALESLATPPWSDTFKLMVELLDDPNPRVRAGAAGVLRGDPHPDADAIMPRLLTSPDVVVRQLGAGRFPNYAMPSAKTMEFQKLCLKDTNPIVRMAGVAALVHVRTPESEALITAALDDPAYSVREVVQNARRRNPAEVQDDALLPADAKVAGPQAVPVLVKLLNDPKPSVRQAAATRLSQNPVESAEQALQQALRSHPDVFVQISAIQSLLRKPPTPAVMQLLREAMHHPDAELRENALQVLARALNPETLSMVASLLGDPSANVRLTAATILSASPGATADDLVLPLLSHADWQIRQQAVQRFTRAPSPRAIEGLGAAAAAAEREIGVEALRALGSMKEPAAIVLVGRSLDSSADSLRAVAAEILRNRSEPVCAEVMLKALVSHPRIDVRIQAAMKFEAQPTPAALESLLAAARHEDDSLRAVAIRALGRLNEAAATSMIVEALNDPTPEVRMAAATVLIVRRDDASEQALIAALSNHSDVEIRRLAAVRFQQVPTPKAVPALTNALKQEDDQLRLTAVQALQRTPVEAIEALIAALDDPSELVRQGALGGLTPQADPRAKAAVAAYLAKMQALQ